MLFVLFYFRRVVYQCNNKYKGDKKCDTPVVTEDEIKEAFVRAVNLLLAEKVELISNVQTIISVCCGTDELKERQVELKEEMAVVAELAGRCVNENVRVAMDQDEYNERYDGLIGRYETVKADYDAVTQEITDRTVRKKQMEQFILDIEKQETVKEFDERIWCILVDCVTVYSGKRMVVSFKDGTEI